ncbi:hypothetical protein SSP35_03_02290 [Streptomyces sp. NBRC 110611]|uniref:hypothetical protein n=1 Tax=Streptomyces sp. NBRC 110611 TaxID=1621259 RepID=UPI0008336FAC|nr:hypothetical protein [Streptomyces sp. NBRC 110611]GAU66581.1 hypothetical protein SSP35_03_02290 [Streptomyces sp. NBRC 110611]
MHQASLLPARSGPDARALTTPSAPVRDLRWLVALAAVFTAAQVYLALATPGLGWDETVYVSQVDPDAPAAFFSAPRARGVSLLLAPLAALTTSAVVLHCYLAVLSGAGFLLTLCVWRRLLPAPVPALGGALFAGLWVTLFYGPQVMPNLWVGYAALIAVGCFLLAVQQPSAQLAPRAGRGAAVGLALAVAVAALMRPVDAVWLAVPLFAVALCVPAWRRSTVLLALPVGVLLGCGEWVVEAYLSYGGLPARLRQAAEIQGGLGWHPSFGDHVRVLQGKTLCRPCDLEWKYPVTAAWWFALPVAVVGAVWAAARTSRPGGRRRGLGLEPVRLGALGVAPARPLGVDPAQPYGMDTVQPYGMDALRPLGGGAARPLGLGSPGAAPHGLRPADAPDGYGSPHRYGPPHGAGPLHGYGPPWPTPRIGDPVGPRHRYGPAAAVTLPALAGLCLAAPYLLMVDYAAPRFLLPAYALLLMPAAWFLHWLTRLPRRRHAWAVAALVIALLGHEALQLAILQKMQRGTVRGQNDIERIATTLQTAGLRPPCVVSGEEAVRLAYRIGCASRQPDGHDASITPAALTSLGAHDPTAVVLPAHDKPPHYARDWHPLPLPPTPGLTPLSAYVSPAVRPAAHERSPGRAQTPARSAKTERAHVHVVGGRKEPYPPGPYASGEPEFPAEPAFPAEPDTPAEPGSPAEPDFPAEPDTPAEPDAPDGPYPSEPPNRSR